MNKKIILLLAFSTLVGFSLLGWYIMDQLLSIDLINALRGTLDPLWQALVGITYGSIAALIGWRIVQIPLLETTNSFFTNLIGPIRLTTPEVVLISFCAGTGEEIFFRGAIQPWLGIWITSVLFVALHGYLSPWNRPLLVYGLYMVLIILGIGYMAETLGLIAAISAHTAVDIVLLNSLTTRWKNKSVH